MTSKIISIDGGKEDVLEEACYCEACGGTNFKAVIYDQQVMHLVCSHCEERVEERFILYSFLEDAQ